MSASECTSDDGECKKGNQAAWVHGSSSAVIFIGAIMGQLTLGYLGDLIGRSNGLILTIALASISALFSAILPNGNASSVYASVITIRFFLGVGLGGVFPLSATKSSEDNGSSLEDSVNPVAAAWTYFWQMPGIMGLYIVALVILDDGSLSTSYQWRVLLGVGAIPSFLSLLGLFIERYTDKSNDSDRIKLLQSEITKIHKTHSPVDENETRLSVSIESDTLKVITFIFEYILTCIETLWSSKLYRNYMIGTGGTWFLFDVVIFGVSLSATTYLIKLNLIQLNNSIGSEIIASISDTDDDLSSSRNIRLIATKQLIATSMGVVGTITAIYLLQIFGLKKLQIYSFLFIAFCSLLLACLILPIHNDVNGLFAIYCLLNFSLQSGVNITAFALPSALYPKNVRSTYNGIASALGKLGAVLGSYSFFYIAEASNYAVVMGITCAISVVGAIISIFYLDQDKIERSTITKYSVMSNKKLTNTLSAHGSLVEDFSTHSTA